MLYTSIHTMYILIAIWLVPGAGGIFPSEIIKSVSSLSGNLLNDLCCYVNKNLSMEPFFNLDYLCFHYYLAARNCSVCRESCYDYRGSGLLPAFRSVVLKIKNVIHQPRWVRIEKIMPSVSSTTLSLWTPAVSKTSGTVFSQYGPPGWWITYIYFFTCHVLKNVVRVIEGKIIYKITRREMKIGSS